MTVQPNELNDIYQFLTYFFIIDSLMTKDDKSTGDKFSSRSSILLGNNRIQRKIVQNHLGTAYGVRCQLVHSFQLPNSADFKKFFSNDIKKAKKLTQVYLRLILIRLIDEDFNLIDLNNHIGSNNFNDVKIPLYKDYIKQEIDEIILQNVININKEDLDSITDDKGVIVYGLNTIGGLTEKVNIIFEEFESFYINGVRIIPENEIWDKVLEKLKDSISNLNKLTPNKLKIISKSHLSFIFCLGFYLKLKREMIQFEFNNQYINLEEKRETNNDLVNIEVLDLASKDDLFFCLSFSDDLFLVANHIINQNYNTVSKLYLKPKISLLNSKIDLFSLLKTIEESLYHVQNLVKIKNIHLLIRIPTPLVFLIGKTMKKFSFTTILLYEREEGNQNGKELNYKRVLILKNES